MTNQEAEFISLVSQLDEAKNLFGNVILDLNDITVEPKSILLEHDYTQEMIDEYDEEYVFSIDEGSMWSFSNRASD